PEAVVGWEQDEGDCRTERRAGGVERLVEPDRLAQVRFADRPREHRRADRLPQPAAHPRQRAGDDHLRPAVDRDQQAEPDDRRSITADREALAPRDAVAVPAAPELDDRRRAVGHALDDPDGERRSAEAGGYE